MATRRKYEKVVSLLGYAVIAAAAVVGWIGYSSFSDIEDDVQREVLASIRNADTDSVSALSRFEEYDGKMSKLLDSLEEAEGRWSESIRPALAELEGDETPDLMGRFLTVRGEGESDQGPAWRRRATAVVLKIVEHVEEAQAGSAVLQFSPDEVFNVAQLSRRIARYDLEGRLVQAAYEAQPRSAAARALSLQSRARAAGRSDEASFDELMKMVSELTIDNPHIVLAEAWNAAEDLRRYDALISAIDELIARRREDPEAFLPSYAHALKGRVHLRRALGGDVGAGTESLAEAVNLLKAEGMHSQWAESTVEEIVHMTSALARGGTDTTAIDGAIESSGIPILESFQELLEVDFGEESQSGVTTGLLELLRTINEEMTRNDDVENGGFGP